MATVRKFSLWGGYLLVLLALPQFFDSILSISIFNQMAIAIVFALSYNMLLGQGGMLSFGHAVYFGLGGFLAVHTLILIEFETVYFSIIFIPLVGGFFGLLAAIFIGSFSTRKAGTVFAMISLGIGELIAASSLIFVSFFGGEAGVSGDRTFGPLRAREAQTIAANDDAPEEETGSGSALNMGVPLLVLVGGALGFMLWTGGGNMLEGSGSQSILWAVCLATAIAFILLLRSGKEPKGSLIETGFKGMGDLLPAVTVIFLALVLGASLKALGTGEVLGSLAGSISFAWALPAIVFVVAGITSFTTGTSWGTYGILVPVAIPLALGSGVPPSLALAAVLGGGVFGDHCSPISDTSIIASLAAECDHIEHVRTQLPYALTASLLAVIGYLAAGIATTL